MSASHPNIVYILADDMGYGDVSRLNAESRIHTTNLDRMAEQGMAFTDAHASSAVCTPSRYSILTGRYNWRSTLKHGVNFGYSPHLIEPDRMTVASLLKQHGYRTACFGKWHLGMDFPTVDGQPADGNDQGSNIDWAAPIANGPLAVGFDTFYGISASLDMHPYVYIENDHFVGAGTAIKAFLVPNRPGPAHPDFEAVDVLPTITGKAVEFIDAQAQETDPAPFFVYMPLNAPHTPLVPTAPFRGKSGLNDYADFCLQVDACVGEVMDALDRNGVADETLIVFTSDNGCSPMADFEFLHSRGHRPSYHFRGHKADIWEGGHRIPLIARWPAVIPPGSERAETVCLADLLATTAEILGVELPADAGEDSVSHLPLLRGDALDSPLREATVHHSISGMFSIRQGRWKLEMCPGSGGWSAPTDTEAVKQGLPAIQLYDLETDIGEGRNVSAQHPDIVDRLTTLLTRYVTEGRSTPGVSQPNDGPRYWEQLNWMEPTVTP